MKPRSNISKNISEKGVKMPVKLGINTGFALNRFTTPELWIPLVTKEFGLKCVQLTADLINPSLGSLAIRLAERTRELCERYNIRVEHTFTGAFTRVNHLGHPDEEIRKYWIDWFCRFADISSILGVESMGSHFAILTSSDNDDQIAREMRFKQICEGWKTIAKYAAGKGIKYLTWEPMSISREFGETIKATDHIQRIVNKDIAIPMKLCLDVDHGDLTSGNPEDTDPYAWIRFFARDTALIHLKQTLLDKGGHWPFTQEYNTRGIITPDKLLACLDNSGITDVTLLLELSFKERNPTDKNVIKDIQISIDYWRKQSKRIVF
ncbi:MAG: TIM barrel protein [Oligoflexales bacterium]|nr:TIM barrel protein [Oligoflexales bacterium]